MFDAECGCETALADKEKDSVGSSTAARCASNFDAGHACEVSA
jgi:hypothetical protein